MIKIIADSTCDLPDGLHERYNITTVPLKVSIANKTYVDKTGISRQELFGLIEKYNEISVTSAPPPEDYRVEMERAVKNGDSVICTTISSNLSASYQSAMLAASMVGGDIHVIDTRTASGGGLIALLAARLAQAGEKVEDIVKACREKVSRQRTLIALETVEYLRKGGRISAVAARMAGLLGIKPIINVTKEGTNEVIHKTRSYQKSMEWILHYTLDNARDLAQQTFGIAYSSVEEPALRFLEMLKQYVTPKEILIMQLGSVVATHIGPGGFGIFWEEK